MSTDTGQEDTEDLFGMVLDPDCTDARFYVLGQNEGITDSVVEMKAWLIANGYCRRLDGRI